MCWELCSSHFARYMWVFCLFCFGFFPCKSRPIWTIVVYSSGKMVLYPASYSNACKNVNCYESPLNTENVPSSNSVVGDSLSSRTVVSQLSFFQQRTERFLYPSVVFQSAQSAVCCVPQSATAKLKSCPHSVWHTANEIHSSWLHCVTANKGVPRYDWLIHE